MVILVELKRGLTPSPDSTLGKLSTAVWVRRTGFPSLDPMGMLTHPRQASRRLRHCRDGELVVVRKVQKRNVLNVAMLVTVGNFLVVYSSIDPINTT